jgi:hypothetical protein
LASSVNPETFSLDPVLVKIISNSALLSTIPTAIVLSVVSPDKSSFAVPLIFLELTLILLSIGPDKVAIAVHFVVKPLAGVLFLVTPNVDTFALNFIHLEFSLVNRTVRKCELPSTVFLSFVILAFVDSTIGPGL